MSSLWHFASGASALTAIALTVRRWAFDTIAVDAVYYTIHPAKNPTAVWPFLLAALILISGAAAMKRLGTIGAKLTPCWLLWPLLALPQDFFGLAAALAVTAWSLSRFMDWKIPRCPLSRHTAYCFAALLALAVAGWSFFLQNRAFKALFLAYQDWGEYAECYLRLADGKTPLRGWLVQAGHFNPVPNLVMGILFKFQRSPEVVFFVSSLLLGILPILVYRLGREYRLPRCSSIILGSAAAFSPVLINQSLSLFYGFHPVLFQGPLIIGFFIFERRKCRTGMAAMLILSLLVQETAAVLWFGYALYLVVCKRFRLGAILALVCIGCFVTVSKVVMPFAAGAESNPQLFHYAQLGDSLEAVMMSPFLRPRAFWGTLFQKQNLFFAAALLLPCGVLALHSPSRILIALPLFAGVVMQNSTDVKNPSMQYGFEITVVLLCAAVAAGGALLRGRTEMSKRALRSGLRTVAVMTLLCAVGWSRMPVGKYSAKPILNYPDMTRLISALRSCSEPGSRVLSTKRLRLYHMFDRQVAPLESEWRPGDTIVLDLADAMEPVTDIRSRLLNDQRAVPCWPPDLRPSDFVVWKIAATPRPPWPFLRRSGDAEFRRIGLELQQNDPAFEARAARAPNGQLLVLIRIKAKVDYDVSIRLKMQQDGKEFYHTTGFGNIYPMWYATPGDTFIIPISGPMPTALQLAITRRK